MAQDQGQEVNQPAAQEPPKTNRRRLLGNIARAIVGTAVGIPVVREIKQTVEQKVETTEGVFYPLYEFHYSPIEKLPDKVDVYWREWVGESLPDDAFLDPNGFIRKSLYEKGAKIAFGDVDYRPQDLSKDQLKATSALISASLMPLVPITAVNVGRAIGSQFERDPKARKISRRAALATLGATTFAATGLNYFGREVAQVEKEDVPYFNTAPLTDIKNPAGTALGRAITKLDGIISDFHPEAAITFFRNAVWAHKLLEHSKVLKKDLGRKPNYALAIGDAHAGVEEFLIAGQTVIEACISAYPKEWLSEVMKTNGGIEKFSSIRIAKPVKSPIKAFTLENVESVVDQPLVDTLTKKLS